MITGINHITLAVSNLKASFAFYRDIVGLTPVAIWANGAYLAAGSDWVCLTLDANTRQKPLPEYTHVAFSIDEESLRALKETLREKEIGIWQENHSEGASVYFLDPDGHKLEAHRGDLQSRMKSLQNQPGLSLFTAKHGAQTTHTSS